ncbi:MAG: MarR family winged helix-turn-helix transcriptional regulator [Acidimicrobiales bacterium]
MSSLDHDPAPEASAQASARNGDLAVAQLTGPVSSGTTAARALVRATRHLERASHQLSLPQYRLLVMVATGDQRATKLAGALALSKPTVTAVVEGLVERGFLARSVVSGDRRAVCLSLTAAGRDVLAATDAVMEERLAGVLAHCEDPAAAEAGLLQLAGALERLAAEHLAYGGK